jgi:hypothetical protein
MDKPSLSAPSIKSKSPIAQALRSAFLNNFTVISQMVSGYCPTAQEYLEFINNFGGDFWTLHGYTLLTEIPLALEVRQRPQGVQQPPSLVSQAAREVAKYPAMCKRVPDIWNLKFEVLIQKVPIDSKALMKWFEQALLANQLNSTAVLYVMNEIKNKALAIYEFRYVFGANKALEKWLIDYLVNNAGKTESGMEVWRSMLEYLPVRKSEEILAKVAKKLLKQGPSQQSTIVNLLEVLVAYRCDLRDAVVKLIHDNQLMKMLQDKIRTAEFYNINVNQFMHMLNNRDACEKFCRDQLLKKIGFAEKK